MNRREKMDLAGWAMNCARKSGAMQVAVSLSVQRENDIQIRERKLEKLEESNQSSLTITVYVDRRYSSHVTNDLRKSSLQKFISDAISSTRYLSRDLFRSLPDPKYYPENFDRDLEINDSTVIDTTQKIDIASEIESAALTHDDRIISVTAGFSDLSYETVRLHSNGFCGETRGTFFSKGAEVTVTGGNGARPSDYFFAQTRYFNDLPESGEVGQKAANRALDKIGQGKLQTGIYDAVVENRAGARLISLLQGPMKASLLQQKNSFLEGQIGEKIADERMTLIDDPFINRGIGSRLFDSEGLAAKRRILIDRGVLKEYYVDYYYGQKLDLEPTSGSSSNIVFEYGHRPMASLIKDIQHGVLIRGFLGGNFNSTTGDFSFGIVGAEIEKGEISKPVNEMNISGNCTAFWHQLAEMGNDPYKYSSWRVPSMCFSGIHFSGS